MAITKENIHKIAQDAAARIVSSYKAPESVIAGLSESMGEEMAAGEIYLERARHAVLAGDCDTAALYKHLAEEENHHYEELAQRLVQLQSRTD